MEAIQTVDIYALRAMLSKAKTVDDIKALKSYVPKLSAEEQENAHRNMNDGIYRNGILVGEKHPND